MTSIGGHVDVFISYRREDSGPSARRLATDLGELYGDARVFFDEDDVPAGASFPQSIDQALSECAAVLAVIGPGWHQSLGDQPWIRRELGNAQQYQKPVFPVLVDGASMPEPSTIVPDLQWVAYLNAIPQRSGSWDDLVGEVVAALSGRGLQPQPQPGAALAAPTSRASAAMAWTESAPVDAVVARLSSQARLIGGRLEGSRDGLLTIHFGSRTKTRILGMPLAKPQDLPVVAHVSVARRGGITAIDARCDEEWGSGVFNEGKYRLAFERIWDALVPVPR